MDGIETSKGTSRKRKGWDGAEMELAHKCENKFDSGEAAAVDLRQFHNTKVGEGYQAKHVIRQRTGKVKKVEILDMSQNTSQKDIKLKKYLQSDGIRDFRRLLEQILESNK